MYLVLILFHHGFNRSTQAASLVPLESQSNLAEICKQEDHKVLIRGQMAPMEQNRFK